MQDRALFFNDVVGYDPLRKRSTCGGASSSRWSAVRPQRGLLPHARSRQPQDRPSTRPRRAADAARVRRRSDRMIKRRAFLTLLVGAAACPPAAHAQQPSVPVVGFLNSASPEAFSDRLRAFHRGLKDTGFVEGENVAIVYRWAENQFDQLPDLAAELVRRRVAVIVANSPAALPAQAATTSIPIVFIAAEDPVRSGLVASIARPDNNLTG
jgi:hypothetical protein